MSAIIVSDRQEDQIEQYTVPLGVDSDDPALNPLSSRGPLGQRLLSADLIGEEELESALRHQVENGHKLGESLLELGFASEEQLLPFVETQIGVAGVRLREGMLDPVAVQIIPRPLAEKLGVLALFRVRNQLAVAMDDPSNLDVIDCIEKVTGFDVRPVFAFRASITRILQRAYEEGFHVDTVTADMDESAVELQLDSADMDVASVHNLVDGSPVINLVNYLILQAIRKQASDIHIEPNRKFGTVRFRIDGQLIEMLRPRRDIFPAIVSRIKVMAKLDIAEQRTPQDGRCQVVADGKEVDLRVSTLPTVLGEKVVIRVLDKARLTFNLERLGIPDDVLTMVKALLKKPYGLVLVTGPTGSGKTTTLYSALELIKSVHHNIVTVEDPVEYQIELVNQVQVDSSRNVNFATALRSILRQDPDVIMVGEIRDAETAKVAVQAALTGHLVLSTLHTNDSVSAITRMTDMGIEGYKLAAALQGVIAQRLVRTICPHCRSSYYPSAEYLEALKYRGDKRRSFSRGQGCRECFDTGFQGRIGIYEVLPAEAELRRLIGEGASLESVRQWFQGKGLPDLLQCGLGLAEDEMTSLEEVARVAFVE
ncbi:GspE/PulE family protein [Bythopirellula polymerisocia]|uniref:Type II secretion system protein E n=1 Tax=Bythopirellula polymerisocia TaxID=2528003 RepID=A0A5C6D3L9_9BACT|nr:GspE/PulE family protein [Bythopirellula polymerisocia]TWU29459.1 Type II secretion system protein E [Bythopirellula polymerisocia]